MQNKILSMENLLKEGHKIAIYIVTRTTIKSNGTMTQKDA
jgi:hypothetical protein